MSGAQWNEPGWRMRVGDEAKPPSSTRDLACVQTNLVLVYQGKGRYSEAKETGFVR